MSVPVSESELLTVVPSELKKLAKFIVRGFYGIEAALVIDVLIVSPCIKEEDLAALLKYDKKQLRSILNQLKNDQFIKQRMRVETQEDGKMNRHNYYFINYKILVNVVKYKLDRMRQKLETEERDSSCKASFKCTNCMKTYNDFDAKDLYDPYTGEMKCTFCNTVVDEDESAMPKKDSRTLIARFNDEMQPLYNLLRETEELRLAPSILEPEPMTSAPGDTHRRPGQGGHKENQGMEAWSGDATRNRTYDLYDQTVTIDMKEEGMQQVAKETVQAKERPIWMTESTVKGASMESMDLSMGASGSSEDMTQASKSQQDREEIMRALLAHERKGATNATIPGAAAADSDASDSSDSDDDMLPKKAPPAIATTSTMEMESEEEEEEEMVTIGNMKVPLSEVTDEMVAKMSPTEKETYIRMGQEAYAAIYE
ncbi:general transcription factor IIE subunit 1-like [Saccoglossus kowalevskii]|uniref:General transcription factor IIE subunit 1-like n=1 Tax=Saccoglossus kowalevskii TaxID=10224 RepID=A0ABM0GPH6_SACKO|nr:PREDICTED: general transcription factor IIE subunit 1-like [Saccoglossus kowalevskii]